MPDDLSEGLIFLSEVVCAAFVCRNRAMIASIIFPVLEFLCPFDEKFLMCPANSSWRENEER